MKILLIPNLLNELLDLEAFRIIKAKVIRVSDKSVELEINNKTVEVIWQAEKVPVEGKTILLKPEKILENQIILKVLEDNERSVRKIPEKRFTKIRLGEIKIEQKESHEKIATNIKEKIMENLKTFSNTVFELPIKANKEENIDVLLSFKKKYKKHSIAKLEVVDPKLGKIQTTLLFYQDKSIFIRFVTDKSETAELIESKKHEIEERLKKLAESVSVIIRPRETIKNFLFEDDIVERRG